MQMDIKVVEKKSKRYIEGIPSRRLLQNEEDVVQLLGLCYDHNVDRIMLYAENLSDRFFDLSSREAGFILQKFYNYRVKLAAVVTAETMIRGKFAELVNEVNRGTEFHVFDNREEAERWLISD